MHSFPSAFNSSCCTKAQSTAKLSTGSIIMANEFLPICDNLFNVISLAAYFCDCVFDIVLGYALLERGRTNLFIAVVLIISGSLIVSQVRRKGVEKYLKGVDIIKFEM